MELNVLLLGVLKFKDKETGESRYRISYILNDRDAFQDTQNFKGVNELSFYTDNDVIFEKISINDILKPCVLKIVQKPSLKNPLKMISQVVSLKTKNDTIDLN